MSKRETYIQVMFDLDKRLPRISLRRRTKAPICAQCYRSMDSRPCSKNPVSGAPGHIYGGPDFAPSFIERMRKKVLS